MTTELRDNLIIGLGNPLLDISAVVDGELLKKYDLKPNDAILAEEKHMPLYKELVDKYKAEYIAGGSVQNSLRVAQWVMRRPGVALFFGCIGNDDYGRILDERATASGVNAQYQRTTKQPSGTCAVLITGTQRSLCANLAAANEFSCEELKSERNVAYLRQAEYFYVSGFFFTASFESVQFVETFTRAAAEDGSSPSKRLLLMNLSAPFVPMFYKENLREVMPAIDVLFGNETEARAVGDVFFDGDTDLKSIGLKLANWTHNPYKAPSRLPNRLVIITQGSEPVLLFSGTSIREFPVQKLPAEEIVDTNGAGDAFVGGFLAQFVQKRSIDTCIECGIWTAREIIKRSGCTFEGEPTFQPSQQ
uniref:Adenosine kinase n=1 Tax=Anopheles triannulatus TaxID=58253 RepID=A0A2M4AQW4_9DIPT